MRLARAIATLCILLLILIGTLKQPVHAVTTCEEDCGNAQYTCSLNVANTYYSCMSDCDTLYPWWSGCPNYCLAARDGGWEQCDNDYNSCIAGCP